MFLPGVLRAIKVDMKEVQVPLLFYTDLLEAVRGTGECLGAGTSSGTTTVLVFQKEPQNVFINQCLWSNY